MKKYLVVLLLLVSYGLGHTQTLNQEHIGMYIPLLNGSACDSTTLNAALASSASLNKTVILSNTDRALAPCTWAISAPVIVPVTRHLHIPPGSMFVNGGGTLTFDHCPIAGRYQIFSGYTTGLTLKCETVYPEWFGTGPTTFQSALDAMTVNGGVLELNRGTYVQNAITAKSNVIIKGKGIGRTIVQLANSQNTWLYGQQPSSPLIVDDTVLRCGMQDLEIDGNAVNNTGGPPGQGIISPRGFSYCLFENLYIRNTYADGIGSLVRTRDSMFRNLRFDTIGRACISSTGGTLRNTFQDVYCDTPFNSCFDIEPSDITAHFSAHYSKNKILNWTCISPGNNGYTSSFNSTIAAAFTGTRQENIFSNLSVIGAGKLGFQMGDLNQSTYSNIVVENAAQTDANGYGIKIGGYSALNVDGITLTGCTVKNTGSGAIGFIIDDASPGTVSNVSVSGCTVTGSSVLDFRIEGGMNNVSLSAVKAGTVSVSNAVTPINIQADGQGPNIATAAILTPLGFHTNYILTGTTTVNEVTKVNTWLGRVLTFTFSGTTLVTHDNETTQTPIYLANNSNVTFCAGDTLTVKMTDFAAGESRLQEVTRSRALRSVDLTTGTTPSVACATQFTVTYAAPTSITDFLDSEPGIDYTFIFSNSNVTLIDVSTTGNFKLEGSTLFNFTGDDVLKLRRIGAAPNWHEVTRSLN